jgi:hypothetical protein
VTIPLSPVPGMEISEDGDLTQQWYAWFNQLYTYVTAAAGGGGGIIPVTTTLTTNNPVVGGGQLVNNLTIGLAANSITLSFMAAEPTGTLIGNAAGSTQQPQYLTAQQVKTILQLAFQDISGVLEPAQFPALTGVITNTSGSTTISFTPVGGDTIMGNNSASAAPPAPLTVAQTQAMLGFVRAFKAVTSPVTNNATLSNDSDLVLTLLPGTYTFQLFLNFWEQTSSAGGFQFDLGNSTAAARVFIFAVVGASAASTAYTGVQQFSTISTSSAQPSFAVVHGMITVTTAGTLGLRWAQITPSTNTTELGVGSTFTAEKIA